MTKYFKQQKMEGKIIKVTYLEGLNILRVKINQNEFDGILNV